MGSVFNQITQLKTVHVGAHSLRYYVCDGWTWETVQHLYQGDIKCFDLDKGMEENGYKYNYGYYTPDPSAKLIVKEFKAHVATILLDDGHRISPSHFLSDPVLSLHYINGIIE